MCCLIKYNTLFSHLILYRSTYFDSEISSEWTCDSQDFLIRQFLEVQGGVLQVVLA